MNCSFNRINYNRVIAVVNPNIWDDWTVPLTLVSGFEHRLSSSCCTLVILRSSFRLIKQNPVSQRWGQRNTLCQCVIKTTGGTETCRTHRRSNSPSGADESAVWCWTPSVSVGMYDVMDQGLGANSPECLLIIVCVFILWSEGFLKILHGEFFQLLLLSKSLRWGWNRAKPDEIQTASD